MPQPLLNHLPNLRRNFARRRSDLRIQRQRLSVDGKSVLAPVILMCVHQRLKRVSLKESQSAKTIDLPGDDLSSSVSRTIAKQGTSNVLYTPDASFSNQSFVFSLACFGHKFTLF